MQHPAVLSLILLLAGCAAGPRTTTPGERATAHTLLSSIDTAITVAVAANKVPKEDAELAHAHVVQLRQKVVESETTPVTFSDLLNEVTRIAVDWLAQKQ